MDAHVDATHVRKVKRYGNASIDEFPDNVDDLTKAIKDIEAPEIAPVRAKVKMALSAAKGALSESSAQVRGRARQATQATDNYVRENPWQAVGLAAAVGIVVGMLVT